MGSTAAASVQWNSDEVPLHGGPYFSGALVEVVAGINSLEIGLTAATARRLRASWVLRPRPEELPRPQWVTGRLLTRVVELVERPDRAELQLGTIGPVTLRVNGEVVARHGEFDNYQHIRQPRVRRYDVARLLRPGSNLRRA